MIRCSNCKMLNRVGSLHCGSCGQLLTDTTEVPEVQFKAPKLALGSSGELDGSAEQASSAAETGDSAGASTGEDGAQETRFGFQIDPSSSSEVSGGGSQKTIMGMPAIRMNGSPAPGDQEIEIHIQEDATIKGRALSDSFDSATPSAQAPVFTPPAGPPSPDSPPPTAVPETVEPPSAPPPPPVANVPSISTSARVQALADTGEDDAPPPRRPSSNTLFGMRAAELHLGLAQSDTSPGTGGGPSLKQAFPSLGDTAELKAVRPAPDLGAPPKRPAKPSPSKGVQIHSVASVKGSGPGFAETAVIRAVGGPSPVFEGVDSTASPQEAEESTASDAVLTPSKPLPSPATLARSVIALGRVAPKSTGRSGSRPTAVSEPVVDAGRDSLVARGLRLLAGLALVTASLLPFAASTWSRVGVWDDLVPIILGAVGLALAFPRRVPLMLALFVGLAGGFLGLFTYLDVGVPAPEAGLEMTLRFGLTLGGGVLLLLAGFLALARPATRPLAQPPPS